MNVIYKCEYIYAEWRVVLAFKGFMCLSTLFSIVVWFGLLFSHRLECGACKASLVYGNISIHNFMHFRSNFKIV